MLAKVALDLGIWAAHANIAHGKRALDEMG
jgi:hypothetical protein